MTACDDNVCAGAAQYLRSHAHLLFFVLDLDGTVLEANAHAASVIGEGLCGRPFNDLIVGFTEKVEISRIPDQDSAERMLSFTTASGLPQTYSCVIHRLKQRVLVFGRVDLDEVESMRKEILLLNQDLSNAGRELHRKNAGLVRLNQQLKEANDKILELTRTDALTQVANRRFLEERLAEMAGLAGRTGHPLSLVMADLDHFKHVNDTFGHEAGDRVLVGFARYVKNSIRVSDLVARFGGEEFVILLPETAAPQARAMAERIRKALATMDLLDGRHFVTASFGVSQFRPQDETPEFIKRADEALYRAKQGGRNRVVVAE
jgi:diguanylate cyclase (GGDEF)-like protein